MMASCDRQQNSLHIKELTYLRFTSFVAVIVQVKILHVEIFDVASSPCATWKTQDIFFFLLSFLLLVGFFHPASKSTQQ